MDSYRFTHEGVRYEVRQGDIRSVTSEWQSTVFQALIAASVEVLRLAEESEARRVYIESFEPQAIATAEENRRLAEERDALKLDAEEAQEINGESSRALAALAGESLIPCGDQSGPCPGHLGPKTLEAYRAALAAWHALQEGNRQAVERIGELEKLLENVREREEAKWKQNYGLAGELVSILHQHTIVGESYPDTLRRVLEERQELTNLKHLHRAVLKNLEAKQVAGESLEDTLARIIREREQRGDHLSTVILEREQARADYKRAIEKCQETEGARVSMLADLRREKLEAENARNGMRAVESENRLKREEIRELQSQLESAKRDQQALGLLRLAIDQLPNELKASSTRHGVNTLLALLSQEEPPREMLDHVTARREGVGPVTAAWIWLREQVADPQSSSS